MIGDMGEVKYRDFGQISMFLCGTFLLNLEYLGTILCFFPLQSYHHLRQKVQGFWDKQGSFTFLDYHLKQAIINGFHGDDLSKVELVRFLVPNSKVLDIIILLEPSSIHLDREKNPKRNRF